MDPTSIQSTIPDRGPIVMEDFEISPKMINLKLVTGMVFGDQTTTAAARFLVEWARVQGGWKSFTPAEIQKFFRNVRNRKKNKNHPGLFHFEALIRPRRRISHGVLEVYGGGWLVVKEGRIHFTVGFVMTCSHPYPDSKMVKDSTDSRDKKWFRLNHRDLECRRRVARRGVWN